MNKLTNIELLSPAKNAETAIAAVQHGADAVYIGAPKFGARAAVGNSLEDIAKAVDYAHHFNSKIYSTVNTVLYDSELKEAEKMIRDLYRIGVDAIIVQDMSILRMDIPPIQLHASTQCDIRTPEKAKFLENVGFSQLVLARELTIEEIKAIRNAVSVPLEYFVHGALCVSYSGRCNASCYFKDRSANRGECSQICRLPYNVYDEDGLILKEKHILSLKDFNLSDRLEDLLEAGVSSFKIEGRLKEVQYVKNITALYNNRLNEICKRNSDKYRRSSFGTCEYYFEPNPEKSFNRGFTHYFNETRNPKQKLASIYSPKSIGEKIGTVQKCYKNTITIKGNANLANGDGLVYIKNDELFGFRANKVTGNSIQLLNNIQIAPGTTIYRNLDKSFSDLLSKDSATRKIGISVALAKTEKGLRIDGFDEIGNACSAFYPFEAEKAKNDQTDYQKRIISKLGNTNYVLHNLDNNAVSGLFIPASILTEIRRIIIESLESSQRTNYKFAYRKEEDKKAKCPYGNLIFSDNVANNLSRAFYTEHGAESIEPAMEVSKDLKNPILMTTRYCIRRQLDACLKEKEHNKIGKHLVLESNDIKMSVEFDCKNCQMILRKL